MNPNPIISSGYLYFPGAWTAVFSLDWSASGRDAPHQTFASCPHWHVQKFKSRRNEGLCGSDRYEGAPGQSWERKAARRWGRAGWAGTARLRARPPTPCKPCTLALLLWSALYLSQLPCFCICILLGFFVVHPLFAIICYKRTSCRTFCISLVLAVNLIVAPPQVLQEIVPAHL